MNERYINYVANILQNSGFGDIQILADGDEFGADILATGKNGAQVCIKCCYSAQPVAVNVIQAVLQAKQDYQCGAAMVVTNSVFTEQAKAYAGKNRVLLKESVGAKKLQTTAVQPVSTSVTQKPAISQSAPSVPVNNGKMTVCKHCGAQIAKAAKTCPVCGGKNKKPIYQRAWLWIIVAFIAFGGILSSLSNTDPSAAGNDTSKNGENKINSNSVVSDKEEDAPLTIGDSTVLDEWDITVNDFYFTSKIDNIYGTYFSADDGNQYAVVVVSITNTAKDAKTFLPTYSVYNYVKTRILYIDGYEFNSSHLLGHNEDLHDSFMNPLTSKEGIIAFEIPDAVADSKEPLSLEFSVGRKSVVFGLR